MFVYGPALLLIGDGLDIARAVASALVGVVCLASALNGFLLRRSRAWERLILFAAAIALLMPDAAADLAGLALAAAVLATQRYRRHIPAT